MKRSARIAAVVAGLCIVAFSGCDDSSAIIDLRQFIPGTWELTSAKVNGTPEALADLLTAPGIASAAIEFLESGDCTLRFYDGGGSFLGSDDGTWSVSGRELTVDVFIHLELEAKVNFRPDRMTWTIVDPGAVTTIELTRIP